jgi:hypothetical protein
MKKRKVEKSKIVIKIMAAIVVIMMLGTSIATLVFYLINQK